MSLPLIIDPDKDAQFVKLYLQTGDALDSYIRTGYELHGYEKRAVAQYMLERPDIQAMLKMAETLKPKAAVEITRESIVSDLDVIHAAAVRASDYTPAIAAKKLQAQLAGFLQENVTVTHRLDVTQMTDERIMELLTAKSKHIEGDFTEVAPQGLGQLSVHK